MKSSALFNLSTLLLFNLSTAAAALAATPAEWDVADTPRMRASVEWISGDALDETWAFYDDGEPYDLSGATVGWTVSPVWTTAETWMSATGEVVSNTVSFSVSATDAALLPGQYWGLIRETRAGRTKTLVQLGIIIRAGPAPDGRTVPTLPALAALVGTNTDAIAILWNAVFPPVPPVLDPVMGWSGVPWAAADAGLEIPTHLWERHAGTNATAAASVEFPDGRIWELAGAELVGIPTHAWRLSSSATAHPPTIEWQGTIYEMSGLYAGGNTNQPTHVWKEKQR